MKNIKTKRRGKTGRTARPAAKTSPAADELLAIAARLGTISASAAMSASWREKVLSVLAGSEDRADAMIRAAQVMRDAGQDVDFANLTICIGAEDIAEDRIQADAERIKISAAIRKKEKEYGLTEDEYWPPGEAPDDVEALHAAHDKRCRQVQADVLREFGENEMADALLADEDAFIAKYREPGRLAHFGPLPRGGNTGP